MKRLQNSDSFLLKQGAIDEKNALVYKLLIKMTVFLA